MFLYAITKEEDSSDSEYTICINPEKIFECHVCKTQHDISDWQKGSFNFYEVNPLNNFYNDYIDITTYVKSWNIKPDHFLDGLLALDNLKAWQVYDVIEKTLEKIRVDRGDLDTKKSFNFDRKYNDLDGSGTVKEAIILLNNLMNKCRRNPNYVVEIL